MGIEALLERFSEKIEALKTKLQGEMIWTHVLNSACICVLVKSTAHSLNGTVHRKENISYPNTGNTYHQLSLANHDR